MTDREEIVSRYISIRDALNKASGAYGGVQLLPVTKTVPAERILCLKDAGVAEIGENRVQEAMEKHEAIGNAFSIHIIGRMQTNKAKYAVKFAKMVQSLDRIELAEALEKELSKAERALPVLVEVNIGRDPAKAGIFAEDTAAFVKALRAYEHLSVRGLMTVAPIVEAAEDARVYFRAMRRLFEEMRVSPGGEHMDTLSMGMSKDCLVAAEEGATLIRVGSAIFGSRA